jgi:hypothetical protein
MSSKLKDLMLEPGMEVEPRHSGDITHELTVFYCLKQQHAWFGPF